MRTPYLFIASLAGFCVLGCVDQAFSAPPKPAKAPPAKAAVEESAQPLERKSEFEEPVRPPYTDPFFPKTKRLSYRKETEKTGPVADQKTVLLEQIVLKGISGPVGRRLALINNYTFAAGESGAVRLPKGTARIEVLDVKERSAVIKVENDPEPKEIFLRPEP